MANLENRRDWRAVVAAFALMGLLHGAWASRVPAFKEMFSLSPATLGILLLVLGIGCILSFFIAGALSQMWGPERLTLRTAILLALTLIALPHAPSILVLGALLFFVGAFSGAMDVGMNGWGVEVEKRRGRSTMTIFHALFSVGSSIGAASGYFAVRAGLAPNWHFLLVALIGGAIALSFILPALPRKPERETPDKENNTERPALFALPKGTLLLISLIAFSSSMGEGAMADWSALFLTTVVNASEARAALGYTVFNAAMVVTRLLGGFVAERFGAVAVTRASSLIALLGILIAIFGGSFAFVLTGFALMGVGYAVVIPLVFSRAAREPGIAPGPAIASVATLGYGGMLIGPPFIGFIAQLTSLRLSFLVLAALALLAAFLAPRMAMDATVSTKGHEN